MVAGDLTYSPSFWHSWQIVLERTWPKMTSVQVSLAVAHAGGDGLTAGSAAPRFAAAHDALDYDVLEARHGFRGPRRSRPHYGCRCSRRRSRTTAHVLAPLPSGTLNHHRLVTPSPSGREG
ncbi:MAG: hypothetical protein AVDCRST_MAG77-2947 [uncultured Chloroflexi bacterium]|uniref:Uncharacterized protein n=1 Tax=uncultured Chloroflexota bacterium TaxID=166587 RepID=A0A6J4IDR8_9CHLR|nr:MAG: hypothetical protein AVDCRST_MAG77-2947 [uncultured Chloroflexota bacterium]